VSLEQAIVAIHHFGASADKERQFHTDVKLEHIQSLSDFVATYMLPRQPHWPVTGENAAKHSSGGHTNAILHNPLAYQPFDPREIGKEISFVFGPLSGGNHAKSIIEGAGYRCADSEKAAIAQYVKNFYATRRKGVTDHEVLAAYFEYRKPIAIQNFDYGKRSNQSEIFLHGRFFDFNGELHESYEGRDSALATLKKAIDARFPGLQIVSYHSESASSGISATSISTIVVADQNGKTFTGKGEDNDIEISAMRALIDGVNHAYIDVHYRLEHSA
jgi:2-isopropylmalate synthase